MEVKKTIITGVVAHVDHGKTTLIDSLVATQGRISKTLAGDLRYMDSRMDEQDRGITLKLSAITLWNKDVEHVIIDTPGHADFEFLVENNSVLSDCFLILIDAVEGITPRTYSLINYIAHDSSILVINKIDKIEEEAEAYETIHKVISSANAMIGDEVFAWERNNIILSCATMCAGINYKHAVKMLGKERSNLKAAIKFIFYLEEKIKAKDVNALCEKFKIRIKNQKNILSTVMPLGEVVFNSVETTYSENLLLKNILSKRTPLRINTHVDEVDTVLFVSLALLKDPRQYTKENMMFIARLFRGNLTIGDELYNGDELVVIEKIFLFGIGCYLPVDSVSGSKLVCIQGKMKKNTLLTSQRNVSFRYEERITPFYKTKLIMKNEDTLGDLKALLRILVNTEQCLRLKVNKFNEVEVLASGKVQVEKLLNDIKDSNIEVETAESDLVFCEYPRKENTKEFEDEDYKMTIRISKIPENYDRTEGNKNQFITNSDDSLCGIIKSILNIFVSCGPIIRESIQEALIEVDLVLKSDNLDNDRLFSILRNNIKDTYMGTDPSITSYFYMSEISIQKEYVGQIYNGLNKFRYILIEEDYDENTDFHTISTYIPHFTYDRFVEEISIRSKGTAYIKTTEQGFIFKLDFSDYIDVIKKLKGLLTLEKIVDNPEKQRTLKR